MPIIKSINPATNKAIATYETITFSEVKKHIQRADELSQEWRKTNFRHRAEFMNQAAKRLRDNSEAYAKLITQEMGKPITQSRSEIEKCAWVCEYYAKQSPRFLLDERISTEAKKSYVRYNPLGVVLAVMPWNFPFWQVFRFAAPALMAGNAGLLKHASNVPGCALAIEEVFESANFPKGLFKTLLIESKMVKKVINHPLVRAVTLTGSEPAGAAVASTAAKKIKKSVLELGGSDPYLILEDADLELAAEVCAQSRLLNTGQSCIGAKRFIVVEKVYDDFLSRFREKLKAAKMGDPRKEATKLGAMAREDLRDELHEQVEKSIEAGAKCILGGKIPKRKGAFYPATILVNIPENAPAYNEELFGPVASVFKVANEEEAITLANDSKFGLGAAVFTRDLKRGERIAAEQLEAGCCFVNGMVKSDPRLPFGGIKTSGYGRELSHHGIKEFMNAKTVYISSEFE